MSFQPGYNSRPDMWATGNESNLNIGSSFQSFPATLDKPSNGFPQTGPNPFEAHRFSSQSDVDAEVTKMDNPNRVGTGYIPFSGGLERNVDSAENWQASSMLNGGDDIWGNTPTPDVPTTPVDDFWKPLGNEFDQMSLVGQQPAYPQQHPSNRVPSRAQQLPPRQQPDDSQAHFRRQQQQQHQHQQHQQHQPPMMQQQRFPQQSHNIPVQPLGGPRPNFYGGGPATSASLGMMNSQPLMPQMQMPANGMMPSNGGVHNHPTYPTMPTVHNQFGGAFSQPPPPNMNRGGPNQYPRGPMAANPNAVAMPPRMPQTATDYANAALSYRPPNPTRIANNNESKPVVQTHKPVQRSKANPQSVSEIKELLPHIMIAQIEDALWRHDNNKELALDFILNSDTAQTVSSQQNSAAPDLEGWQSATATSGGQKKIAARSPTGLSGGGESLSQAEQKSKSKTQMKNEKRREKKRNL